MKGLFAEVVETHSRPLVDAVRCALDVVVEELELELVQFVRRGAADLRLRIDHVRTRVIAAPVVAGQQQQLLWVAEMFEARQGPVGGAGVQPADGHEHRHLRTLDGSFPMERMGVLVGQAGPDLVVAIRRGADGLEHIRVLAMLEQGRGEQLAVFVFLDALNTRATSQFIAVEAGDHVTPGAHQRTGQQAVGPHRRCVEIEVRPTGDDGLQGRMLDRGKQFRGGARVRRPVGANALVAPGLLDHPLHQIEAVAHFLWSVLDRTRSKARAASARIDLDQGVAGLEEHLIAAAQCKEGRSRLRVLARTPVARDLEQRRNLHA